MHRPPQAQVQARPSHRRWTNVYVCRINVYRDRGCPLPCTTRTTLCSLLVLVTDGAAGTAAQWSRDTTFFGFSNVHDCALLSRLLCG